MVKLDRSAVPLKSGKGIYPRLRVGIALLSSYQQAARIRLLGLTFRTGSLGPRRALRQNSPSSINTSKRKPLVLFIYIANISRHLYIVTILDLYGQFEPSPWQLLQLGFFSLRFHFGKSPPLSIKPEVHRVGRR